MRRINPPLLRAKPNGATLCAPEPPSRKVFNCIVDDTALIAGVKKSTRDGIRKWVLQGSVRLFVPLHTLALLDRLKKGNERINADAREAIKWLDDITESSGRVQLEGTDEQYTSWAEVEKFMLPETLLSMEQSDSEEEDEDDYLEVEDLESSFNQLDISDETSMSSSHSMEDRPKTPESPQSVYAPTVPKLSSGSTYTPQFVSMESPNRTARNSAEIPRKPKSPKGAVPTYLQPLFNHILWRIHQEVNPDAALESYILLTNDPTKQTIAQRFGIRAKRLEQLRDAVGREDREYKNRMVLYKMENNLPQTTNENTSLVDPPTSPKKVQNEELDSDEDVVVLKRAPRGPQATTPQSSPGQRVWDPNEFGRADQTRGGRGGRGGHNIPRGRGGRGGRGGYVPRGAYVPPVGYRAPPAPRVDPSQPIDPDSFARPAPRVNNTRGGRRKLWEPN